MLLLSSFIISLLGSWYQDSIAPAYTKMMAYDSKHRFSDLLFVFLRLLEMAVNLWAPLRRLSAVP